MKNFLRLDGLSILSVPYMYIDHKDYLEFCNSIMETLGQNRGDA